MTTFDGDYEMFHRTRIQTRRKILENKDLTDPIKIQEKIFFGEEARQFLNVNVMQGKLQESGNYRFKARKQQTFKDSGM